MGASLSCYTIGLGGVGLMALQYGQWVAWEIVTKREMEMGQGVGVRLWEARLGG